MSTTRTNLNFAHHLVKYEVWPPPAITLSANWSQYSDEELITLYQTADPIKQNKAFSAIFNRYRLKVDDYVKRKVSDEWEARAVFCDVWLKAMDKLETFVCRGKPLEHWFRSVGSKTVKEHYRNRCRHSEKASRFVEATLKQLDKPQSPAEMVILEEQLDEADERFFEARATLKNPLQQKIITMIYFDGITNSDQIAKRLGVKSGAIIRSNHSRALKRLAKHFKKQRREE